MTRGFNHIKNFGRKVCFVSCMLTFAAMGMCLLDGAANTVHAELTNSDCMACHENLIPEPYVSNLDYHHNYIMGEIGLWCSGCHNNPDALSYTWYGDNCGACHSLQGHEVQHDKTDVPQALCADCHLPNVYTEHQDRPLFQNTDNTFNCGVCHDSANPDVQDAIAAGRGPVGQVVFCDDCHINMTGASSHTAQHDNVFADSATCVQCHADNVVTEHLDRGWTCSTCHSGETLMLDPAIVLQVIDDAVSTNPTPQTRYCTDCHTGFGGHEADHNQGFFLATPSSQDCTRCHASMNSADPNQANLVTEHVTNRGLTCGACHDRTDQVFDAINKGRLPSDQPVYCVDCHTDSGQGEGHALVTVEPWSECTWCHTLDIFEYPEHTMHLAAARDMQQDCSVCHAPQGTRPDCVLCHALEQTMWDPLPINRTSPNDSLNIIGPGAEDHDRHTDGIACTYCHVNGVPGSDPLPVPYSECANCHNSGGPGSDIAYGSTVHTAHIADAQSAGQGCAYCHSQTPACTDCHAIAGPNMVQHDTHTDTLLYTCTECHVNGIAGSEPLPAPYNQCADCHNSAGPGSDIVYGSTIHTNNHIAGGETSGQSCSLCHGPVAPDCSSCHAPGHPPIPAPYNQCSTCHNGTGTLKNIAYGQPVHDTHMTEANNNCAVCHAEQPNCIQCHTDGGGDTHKSDHDNAGVPSPGCANCHDANVVIEHVDNRMYTCATCHDSVDTNVINAINTGKAGTFVTCYDCHAQNNHHSTTESQSGNCTHCHADARLEIDPNAPTGQLACRQCHGANQHDKGGPIQDYGACFACHQPTPYHAKPTIWPGWHGENTAAPGRGSFNLFYNELRPSCAGDCEHTLENRSGYGEHSRPEDDQGRSWRNPSISFNMVTFFDYFTTNKQWTVPTFGAGGGSGGGEEPPAQNDSVNITRALYDRGDDRLEIRAENSLENNAQLTVMYDGRSYDMRWDSRDDRWELRIETSRCNDSTIEVVSSAGGSDTSSVENCSSYYSSWGH
jgi:hypothetical protein